ncbi:helicase, partial [Oryctes borbonicus]
MDDGWDDPAIAATDNGFSNVVDSGRAFSRGRGFSNKTDFSPPGDDGWGNNDADADGGGYNDSQNNFRGSRGGGRGGRGGRGSRGGRGYHNSHRENNNDDFDFTDRDSGRGRGRGGRGGRGGGRGGRDRHSDGDENGEQEEKKREIYIPPELDDDELYSSGNTSGINFIKYENIAVKTNGENVPPPIKSFDQAGLRSLILENVQKSGYTVPTPIQKHAIPIITKKRDLMACAQTGSGKTAAFLLPIIHRLLSDNLDLVVENHVEPQAVIVSPTRELCIQIFNEAKKFAYNSFLKICILYGGTSTMHQKTNVMKGCHILVATPGRLNDFVKRGHVSFTSVQYMVLDEADRMLDMG